MNEAASGTKPMGMLHDEHTGLILGYHPANERPRYFVAKSLIGWTWT